MNPGKPSLLKHFVREGLLRNRGLTKAVMVLLSWAVIRTLRGDEPGPAGDAAGFFLILFAVICWIFVCILANDLADRAEDRAAGKRRWISGPAPSGGRVRGPGPIRGGAGRDLRFRSPARSGNRLYRGFGFGPSLFRRALSVQAPGGVGPPVLRSGGSGGLRDPAVGLDGELDRDPGRPRAGGLSGQMGQHPLSPDHRSRERYGARDANLCRPRRDRARPEDTSPRLGSRRGLVRRRDHPHFLVPDVRLEARRSRGVRPRRPGQAPITRDPPSGRAGGRALSSRNSPLSIWECPMPCSGWSRWSLWSGSPSGFRR